MVATYTDNLRITKQGDNDNPNTWGQVVNNQVIALFEEAISGVVAIDMTGSSNVNIATSVNNGSSDSARHAVLELTGTIGANIDLIVPAVEKVYLVRTNYSGAFTITVKPTGAGSGIVFNSGQADVLYTNGTSIYSMGSRIGDLATTTTIADTNLFRTLVSGQNAEQKITAGNIKSYVLTFNGLSTATPEDTDSFLFSDSSDSNAPKRVLFSSLKPSQAEAEAGLIDTKFMTPLRTAQAITALSPAAPSGTTLQRLVSTISATNGSSTFPNSNSTITTSNGSQVWSQTITPEETDSIIRIEGSIWLSANDTSTSTAYALFRGSTLLDAAGFVHSSGVSSPLGNRLPIIYEDTPNTASPVTYSIRVGKRSGDPNSWYVNSQSTAIFNGGQALGQMIVKEITP